MPDATQPSYLELPVQTRAADVRPGSWDEAGRTVEVIASTGAMVRRYGFMSEYDEEIPVSDQVFDLSRFLTVGPVLDNHNSYGSALNAVGRVESAKIENRQLIATLLFDTDPNSDAIFRKIGRGILRAVSLGYDADYERVRAKDRDDGGDVDLYRATRVTPYEVSVVMMPADAGAVVRNQQPGATRRYVVRDAPSPCAATPEKDPAQPEERAMPTPVNAGGVAVLTDEQTRDLARKAQAESFKRLAETQSLLRTHTLDETLAPDLVQRFDSDVELRAAVLDLIAERDRKTPPVKAVPPSNETRFEPGDDASDKTARAMDHALAHRALRQADLSKVRAWEKRLTDAGNASEIPKPLTDDTTKRFARMRLIDLAETFLNARGVRTAGMSIGRIAELALTMRSGGLGTTSDFPNLLANTANKLLLVGYSESPSPWRNLARRVDRPDFREFSIVRRSGAPRLNKLNEHGEIKRAGYNESPTLVGQLQTAAVSVGFTRQMLINDDLDSFSQTSLGLGDSAVAYEDEIAVTDILYGNPTLKDGTALFASGRGNLSTDVGVPDIAAIKVAAKMFADMGETVQTADTNAGTSTRRLQYSLTGFYGAISEMFDIEQIIKPRYPDAASNAVPSSLMALQLLRDDRLQIEASSPDVHFAFSNRPALVYGGLEGDPSPRLSMAYESSVDGAVWQLVHDTYVAVADPKAIIRIPKS